MARGLNERVKEFRTRPLSEEYPFVWINEIYEKLRYLRDWVNIYAYTKAEKVSPVLENGLTPVAN